jgi:riboflavin synthase
MFTGLVQAVGTLAGLDRGSDGARLRVAHPPWDEPLEPGESVAVQGACLTVAETGGEHMVCDVLAETLERTNLADGPPGRRLNLERALRAGERLGGHIVQGHVDGLGRVRRVESLGRDWRLGVQGDDALLQGMILKGSVAVDGVSLTISRLTGDGFEVNVIPFTWQHTSLRDLRPGMRVNIETDMLGKYVRRCLGGHEAASRVDMDLLGRAGFL